MTNGLPANQRFSEAFPAESRVVGTIRNQVAAVAAECGIPETDLYDIRLAVTEVVTNAIVHAYANAEAGEVRIEVFHQGEELLVVVADDGLGMAPRVASPGLGLGLPLVASLAERVELFSPESGGTEVHLVFDCPS